LEEALNLSSDRILNNNSTGQLWGPPSLPFHKLQGYCPGDEVTKVVKLTTHLHVVPRLNMTCYIVTDPYTLMDCVGTSLPLHLFEQIPHVW